MRVLILSCNTGGGHNAAGRAVEEVFKDNGHEAEMLDYLCLAGDKVSKTVGNFYVETVKTAPGVFGAVYQLGMLVSRICKRSPVYYVNAIMAKYIKAYLKENPADAIIMPHLYPAETITYMKRRGVKLPLTVAVMTDYTCIPFWEETNCDYYITPHESLNDEIIKRGLPEEKLKPFGIPVSSVCGSGIKKSEARAQLGLDERMKYILVSGGSMGAGNIWRLVNKLSASADNNEKIILICGSNRKLYSRFKKASLKGVTVKGHVNNMPLYLRACDIIYTKPGGLTSTEAAVSGIPIVHTSPIPGCETKNRKFFKENGLCITAHTVDGMVKKGMELLRDSERCSEIVRRQKEVINKNSARDIYNFVIENSCCSNTEINIKSLNK